MDTYADLIEGLTFRNYYYNRVKYGMSKEAAARIYNDAEQLETTLQKFLDNLERVKEVINETSNEKD